MSRYAIGDVHGCSTALDALLRLIAPTTDDTVVFLGDLVDRGPRPVAVVERVIALSTRTNVALVLGNHEEMLLSARAGTLDLATWAACGGAPTLVDYDRHGTAMLDAHARFISTTARPFVEDETHIYVHGTVDAGRALDETPSETLRWRRFGPPAPHVSGKFVVAGHTPQKNGRPLVLAHAACIDTWCCGGQWLTALDVDGARLLQAHEDGSTRTLALAFS